MTQSKHRMAILTCVILCIQVHSVHRSYNSNHISITLISHNTLNITWHYLQHLRNDDDNSNLLFIPQNIYITRFTVHYMYIQAAHTHTPLMSIHILMARLLSEPRTIIASGFLYVILSCLFGVVRNDNVTTVMTIRTSFGIIV